MFCISRGQGGTPRDGNAGNKGIAHIHRATECFALRSKRSRVVGCIGIKVRDAVYVVNELTDDLSIAMVKRIQNRYGVKIWPWERAGFTRSTSPDGM